MGDGGSRDGCRACGIFLGLAGTNGDGCAGYYKSGGSGELRVRVCVGKKNEGVCS